MERRGEPGRGERAGTRQSEEVATFDLPRYFDARYIDVASRAPMLSTLDVRKSADDASLERSLIFAT